MNASDSALTRVAARAGRHLLRTERWVTTAESCTGGWISKALTDIAGSSQWFAEGFVTYGNEAKISRLGVKKSALRADGAVSESVARAMAQGALRRTGASVSVAVTGIAGPGGAVAGKPVGTVWLAWAVKRGRRVDVTTQLEHFEGDRDAVRRQTVHAALIGILTR